MDEKCIRCGSPSALPVRALEIRTLPVRGLSGERRVQALGNEITGGVCESCAKEQLNLSLSPLRAAKNQLISLGIGRRFVPHATVDEQRQMIGIDARSIAERILDWMRNKNGY